ncbi:MAG TPA: hypothetical protein VLG48_09065 [Candidatus Methylomirabilis sp.]|nr:hypothetical protein [Candidatus Methylomirabilis sp.]
MARLQTLVGGFISMGGAVVSSLCCVLPLAIVLLGLGSGAFMATTMRYTSVFVPVGVISVITGFYLHLRERRRCARAGCSMVGSKLNLFLLSVAALVVALALFFTLFPTLSSDLLLWATGGGGAAGGTTMTMPTGMDR